MNYRMLIHAYTPQQPTHPHKRTTTHPALIQVLTLLLNGLSSFKKRVKRASVMSGDPAPPRGATTLQRRSSSSDGMRTSQLEAMRSMLQANKSQAREGPTPTPTITLTLTPTPTPNPNPNPKPSPNPDP